MRHFFPQACLVAGLIVPLIANATSPSIFAYTNLAVIPSIKQIQGMPSSLERRILEIQSQPIKPHAPETTAFQTYLKSFPTKPTDNQYFRRKYKDDAENEDAEALYTLGQMYRSGNGSLADRFKSFDYLLQAARKNNADAQFWLAETYAEGLGTKNSAREAIHWYQLAADNGHIGGQSAIGMAYLFGLGVTKNVNAAYKWHKMAADSGNPRAQYLLSQQYRYGEGVEKDLNLADNWLLKAAEGDWPDAQWDMIIQYGKRYLATGDNPEEMHHALKWLEKAVAKNDAKAQQLLGWMFQTGTFVSPNLPVAADLYASSASQGNLEAKFSLAVLLAEGFAVKQDCDRAVSLLAEVTDQGMAKSAIVLGNLYKAGICVPVSYKQTAHWYLRAVQNNFQDACNLFISPITPALLNTDDASRYHSICDNRNEKNDFPQQSSKKNQ